jgi:hypothetical protein
VPSSVSTKRSKLHGAGEEAGGVVVAVAGVVVHGEVIHVLPRLFQRHAIPIRVSRHLVVGGAAQDRLDRRIHPAHQLGGLTRFGAVFVRFEVPHLPGTVHLVADAPVLDIVRRGVTVFGAQVGIVGAGGCVAIIDQVARGLDRAGAHVDAQHRRGVDGFAEAHEFVGAKLVGLQRLPGQLAAARAQLLRADAVEPVVAAEEVAAGIADRRVLLGAQRVEHVGAQAVLVGVGGLGFVDAFVDASPHVLGKAAEKQRRDFGDRAVAVKQDLCGWL